jgi:hypothetical protein
MVTGMPAMRWRPGRETVLPGTDRPGDPHEVTGYDPEWPARFGA